MFVAAFLLPGARTVGPSAAPLMREVNEGRRLHIYMMCMSWFTLLSGGILAWRDAGPLGMQWYEQGSGLLFGIGAVFSIVASVIGMSMIAPTGKRISALGAALHQAQREQTPEEVVTQRSLQDRLYFATRLGAVLLVLAAAAMALARYA